VPTIVEQGFDGHEASSWCGLVARHNTAPKIVQQVSAEVQAISPPAGRARLRPLTSPH
jgi:tripartite-type tricarboxylate transporter receptor subunit TctC